MKYTKPSWLKKATEVKWNEPKKLKYGPDQKYYESAVHRRIRELHLKNNPICVECEKIGLHTSARILDHIVPIQMGGAKKDSRNHQGLCDQHHQIKRAKERRGYMVEWTLNTKGEKIPK